MLYTICWNRYSIVNQICGGGGGLVAVIVQLLWPHGLPPGSFWDFPSKNTGVGCYALLQGIFPNQESKPCLLNCREIFIAEPILLLKRESLVEQPFLRSSQGNLRVIFEVLSICSDLQMEINQKCLDVKTQWFLAFSRSGVRNGKWLQCSGQSHTVKNCPA